MYQEQQFDAQLVIFPISHNKTYYWIHKNKAFLAADIYYLFKNLFSILTQV